MSDPLRAVNLENDDEDLDPRGDGVPGVGQGDLPRLLTGVVTWLLT